MTIRKLKDIIEVRRVFFWIFLPHPSARDCSYSIPRDGTRRQAAMVRVQSLPLPVSIPAPDFIL